MAKDVSMDIYGMSWEQIKRLVPLDLTREKLAEARRRLGRVNILIAGKTGSGKTTLINVVFGKKVGETGRGRPVTQQISWHETPEIPLRLCDTKGLEMADFEATLAEVEREITRAAASGRMEDRIHVAWICIPEVGARVEPGEQRLTEICARHNVPVIVVLTKAIGDEEFVHDVRDLIPEASEIIRVLAAGWKRPAAEPFGLHELVAATLRCIPEAVEKAFVAAQKIDLDRKRTLGRRIAASAAVTAATLAFVPIPAAAAGAILTVNVGMVTAIAAQLGAEVTSDSAVALGASVAAGLAASTGGRIMLGEALKLIPGIGTAVGGYLEATVAATTTYGLGLGFTEFLLWFYQENDRMPFADELAASFSGFWESYPHKQAEPPAIA